MKLAELLHQKDDPCSYINGEHFIPVHIGLSAEDQAKLDELRLNYLSGKTGKNPEEIDLKELGLK
jgi:hypothetical protein|nr:MAG TPA: hypothetical protein [Caudoviricetes sp.]